jgi:23S rRNA (adenine2503-C2)-methyltransferase
MNLYGQTLEELEALVATLSQPSYRARQIAEWLYHHHVDSIEQMSNLPGAVRRTLSQQCSIELPKGAEAGRSIDGTAKYVWESLGDEVYESAVIPEGRRLTLCVSSQSGCKVGCRFCLTARKGLRQQLSAAEIVGQYRSLPMRDSVTHIVFMGMGEPLDNLEPVLASLSILTSRWGCSLSPRRITVSTIGLHPELERLLDETSVNVAISLHAAAREVRLPLVPSENAHPIAQTVETLKDRAKLALPPFTGTGRRRVSFEITLLDGVNDSRNHAEAVRDLITGVPARVNLIPWNEFPGASFRASPRDAVERFQTVLKRAGIMTTIRQARGQDIGAACGLLAGRREGVAG